MKYYYIDEKTNVKESMNFSDMLHILKNTFYSFEFFVKEKKQKEIVIIIKKYLNDSLNLEEKENNKNLIMYIINELNISKAKDILDLFEKNKIKFEQIKKEIKYQCLDIEIENEKKTIIVDKSFFTKLKDISINEFKEKIEILENNKDKLIKELKKSHYGAYPLFYAALNYDNEVFNYMLNLYKKYNIDIKQYSVANDFKIIELNKKNYFINKDLSLFDFCLLNNKIKNCKLLEELNLNYSIKNCFESGGLIHLMMFDGKENIEHKNQILEYILDNYKNDDLFPRENNFLKSFLINEKFIWKTNLCKLISFNFLYNNKTFFESEQRQELFFKYIIKATKYNNLNNINYIKDFVENIPTIIKKHILIKPNLLKEIINLNNHLSSKFKLDNKELNNLTSFYEKSLINNTLIFENKIIKDKKVKFKL